MSLDLGALIGRVILETVEFDRTYVRIVRQFSTLGTEAEKSAAGTATLDEALAALGKSGTTAATGIGRSTKATGEESAAAKRAAMAERERAAAIARVAEVMKPLADATAREQAATLRDVAAQERLAAVRQGATTEAGRQATATARVASAQAASIASTDRLAASQRTLAVATEAERGAMAGMLKTAGELGLVIGAIEIAKKAGEFIMAGRDLTTALNGVQAASHATNVQMRAVRTEAIGLGQDMTVPRASAVDAAQAIDDLVRSGMKLPRAMAAARPALLLAAAAQVDTADAARFLGDTLDDFQLPAAQAAHVANVLAGAATSAGGGLGDMFQAIKYAGPFARAAGVDVGSLVTAIAELAKGGIQGTMAGTGVRMMLQRLAQASPATTKALQTLGVTAWDTQGRFKGLPNLIDQLHAAQLRLNPQQFLAAISTAFGARASTIVASLAHKGIEGYEQFAKVVASGDVQKYAAIMNRGVSANLAAIEKRFTAAGISVYSKFEPALISATGWLGTSLPHAVEVLTAVLGPSVSLIGTGLVGAWHAVLAVLGPVANALGDVGRFLAEHQGLTTGVVTGVLAMWGAWKAYGIVTAAKDAISGALLTLKADVGAFGSSWRAGMTGAAADTRLAAALMEQEFADIAAEAEQLAAVQTTAAARQAEAWATLVASSDDATAQQVANSQAIALAAQNAADAQVIAAETAAAAAAAAADEVDAAGVAASAGWAAALGPLALIGVGVGLLTMLFHSNKSAAQDNAQIMQGYADSLKQSTDALAAVNTQQTIKDLQQKKDTASLTQLHAANLLVGTSTADLVLAVNQGGAAYANLQERLQAIIDANHRYTASQIEAGRGASAYMQTALTPTGEAARKLSGDLKELRDSFSAQQKQQILAQAVERESQQLADGGAEAAARQARGLHLTTNAYLDAQNAAKQNTTQTDAQTAAFQAERDSASLLQQALDGLAGVNLSLAGAQTSVASANLSVIQSFHDNGRAIKGSSAAAVANQQAIQQQVSAAQQLAKTLGDADRKRGQAVKGEKDEIASLNGSKAALEANLAAHHKLTPAVQAYIDRLYDVKDVAGYLNAHPVTPVINPPNTTPTQQRIAYIQSRIDAIKQGHVPGISVNTYEGQAMVRGLQARLNALHNKTITVTVSEKTVGQLASTRRDQVPSYQPKASGGTIAGSGGPKQDNIPIMASPGEEVIQNPYAAMWRPLLKRINSGQYHGYATGGTVGNAPANDPLVTRTLYGPVMGGIRGVAMMLRSQIPGATAAMADLAKAVGEAFQLKGVEQQIDSIKAKLTAVTDYRNSVMQTVSSTFSSQQYGSVGDLLSGFGSATAGNKTVDAQIRKLTGEGVNKDYLSNLVSQGQFTTLATLAGAGRGQIAQVNRAVGAYDSSLYGVGRAATLQKFGSTVGGVQGQLDNAEADRAQLVGGIARLVSVVAKLTGQPVSVSIGQEQVASAVFRSHEFQGVLDELDHLLHYGGNG